MIATKPVGDKYLKEKKMAKKNYDDLSGKILELVGGKENVAVFTHCVTRLRFNVRDRSLVKTDEIGNLGGVIGTQWSGEQFQIIIGQAVDDVYKTICNISGLQEAEKINENLDDLGPKYEFSLKGVLSFIADTISQSITPFVAVLIGAGLIKVINLLLTSFGLLNPEGMTSQMLAIVGDAGFYFLPVFIGKGAAKRFGADEGLGMLMALMLVAPSFMAMVDAGASISFLGLPIYANYYCYSVFPVILTVGVMSVVQKFFRDHSPKVLRVVIEPTCTILVMIPLAFCVLAPLGTIIGNYIGSALVWLYEKTGFIGIAVLGVLYPFLVVAGMHNGTTPYWLDQFMTVGNEAFVSPVDCLNNLNQGIACFAVAAKTKNENLRSTAIPSGVAALVGGISEPALFGVNLKNRTPMIAVCIGNFFAAMFCGIMHVSCYEIYGTGGLFAIPCYFNPGTNNLLYYVIAALIGAVVTFAATFVLYKDKE